MSSLCSDRRWLWWPVVRLWVPESFLDAKDYQWSDATWWKFHSYQLTQDWICGQESKWIKYSWDSVRVQHFWHSMFPYQHLLWDLPHNNIYQMITPDMLHQVKKGVWEHINLFQDLIKAMHKPRTTTRSLRELDLRFSFVLPFPGLKRFPKGIMQLSCITGSEYFQIMNICFTLHGLADHLYHRMASWVACSVTQTDDKYSFC